MKRVTELRNSLENDRVSDVIHKLDKLEKVLERENKELSNKISDEVKILKTYYEDPDMPLEMSKKKSLKVLCDNVEDSISPSASQGPSISVKDSELIGNIISISTNNKSDNND